ncbi:hypothetical protein OAN61_00095 [bacterium]|nr:hypothetical protein [bacterium]
MEGAAAEGAAYDMEGLGGESAHAPADGSATLEAASADTAPEAASEYGYEDGGGGVVSGELESDGAYEQYEGEDGEDEDDEDNDQIDGSDAWVHVAAPARVECAPCGHCKGFCCNGSSHSLPALCAKLPIACGAISVLRTTGLRSLHASWIARMGQRNGAQLHLRSLCVACALDHAALHPTLLRS